MIIEIKPDGSITIRVEGVSNASNVAADTGVSDSDSDSHEGVMVLSDIGTGDGPQITEVLAEPNAHNPGDESVKEDDDV